MIKRKAYAKINLSLDITGKRKDGYHELSTVMQTVNLFDLLTFDVYPDASVPITLNILDDPTGGLDDLRKEDNLVYKAAKLVLESHNINTPVIISLKKNIPIAAGLGGGSSDAAATIRGLNSLLNLNMSFDEMCKLGIKLGADVPFCIMGGTALCRGIGDKMNRIPNPPQCYLLIAKPKISVSTKHAYEEYDKLTDVDHPDLEMMVDAILNQDLLQVSKSMGNVLEYVTIPEHPVIKQIKKYLIDHGAWGALMSGSGPTVFGIFMDHLFAAKAEKSLVENGLAARTFITTYINNVN
ncbi:MAG: 4-(cytidine 5'-diphospho)-2-C-methyl-D-erythritol kinase [Lachnospiraceae bacterium]|nr:4-(cytidine 5'-diphospho)-2-C-methyl-D-erythritol kinase [Lachnospiraceae bacterium]